MQKRILMLPLAVAVLAFSSAASAATVQLGLDDSDVTIFDRVGEAATACSKAAGTRC